MDLEKVKTEDLRKELERRELASKDEDGFPHLFIYSKTLGQFDTELKPVPTPSELELTPMLLRCRYNSQRELTLYSIKLTADKGRLLNERLNTESDHKKIFKIIEKALIEIPI